MNIESMIHNIRIYYDDLNYSKLFKMYDVAVLYGLCSRDYDY